MLRLVLRNQRTLHVLTKAPCFEPLNVFDYTFPACLSHQLPAHTTIDLRQCRSKGYETRRKAPSTYRKERFRKIPSLGYVAESMHDRLRSLWDIGYGKAQLGGGFTNIDLESIVKFYEEFVLWTSAKVPGTVLAQPVFEELAQKHGVQTSEEDTFNKPLNWLAIALLSSRMEDGNLNGMNLMYNMAVHGDIQALFRMLHNSLGQARDSAEPRQQRLMRELRSILGRTLLDKWLKGDKLQFAAAVMEAKLRISEDKHDSAIELLEKVADDVVEVSAMIHANRAQRTRARADITTKDERWIEYLMLDRTDLDLMQPWVILLEIFQKRFHDKTHPEWIDTISRAKKFIQIGCDQDDPRAHWLAASLYRNPRQGSESARWLYHITKAAASGYPDAATELAEYYLNSGWRYIEDDPPAHVRPTAFDKYPMAEEGRARFSWLHWLPPWLLAIVKVQPIPKTPWEDLYRLDAHPTTTVERLDMAFAWLLSATDMHYLPAAIVMARSRLTPTLWSQANAPRAAIGLRRDRYDYETEMDWKARHTPEGRRKAQVRHSQKQASVPADTANPAYNINKAEDLLILVYEAQEGFYGYKRYLEDIRKQRRLGLLGSRERWSKDDLRRVFIDQKLAEGRGASVTWLLAPGIASLYLSKMSTMIEEVKALCDEHRLILRKATGGVWYDYRWKD